MVDQNDLAELICETGRRLYQRGFIAATEGNISCRLSEQQVLCTATMIDKGRMTPADMCVVDLAGRQVSGHRKMTSEILLHLEIYKNNPHTGAVVHCHPPHATAFAISETPLPTGLLAEVAYYLQDVPTLDYRMPGSSGLADLIAAHAKTKRCAILRNHGAISWDGNIERARWWMEVLDAYCRVVILAKPLGEFSALPDDAVAELRERGRRL